MKLDGQFRDGQFSRRRIGRKGGTPMNVVGGDIQPQRGRGLFIASEMQANSHICAACNGDQDGSVFEWESCAQVCWQPQLMTRCTGKRNQRQRMHTQRGRNSGSPSPTTIPRERRSLNSRQMQAGANLHCDTFCCASRLPITPFAAPGHRMSALSKGRHAESPQPRRLTRIVDQKNTDPGPAM